MDYKKIYNKLINKRINEKPSGIFEKHHIIPKSMGGDNSKNNIINLTPREHFIAHRLLFKIYKNKEMAYALNLMCSVSNKDQQRIKINSKKYQMIRKSFVKSISGDNHSRKGLPLSEVTKRKISLKVSKSLIGNTRAKGYKHTKEHKEKISNLFKGKSRNLETIYKIKMNQPKRKNIIVILSDGSIKKYCSSNDAEKELNVGGSNIRKWAREEHTISRGKNKGMSFKYEQ